MQWVSQVRPLPVTEASGTLGGWGVVEWLEDEIGDVVGGDRPFLTVESLCNLEQETPMSLSFPSSLKNQVVGYFVGFLSEEAVCMRDGTAPHWQELHTFCRIVGILGPA